MYSIYLEYVGHDQCSKKVQNSTGIKSILSVWKFYVEKSYDFEMLRCELQTILEREGIVVALEKEKAKQLRMKLMHHSYGNLLDTIKYLALCSGLNTFAV